MPDARNTSLKSETFATVLHHNRPTWDVLLLASLASTYTHLLLGHAVVIYSECGLVLSCWNKDSSVSGSYLIMGFSLCAWALTRTVFTRRWLSELFLSACGDFHHRIVSVFNAALPEGPVVSVLNRTYMPSGWEKWTTGRRLDLFQAPGVQTLSRFRYYSQLDCSWKFGISSQKKHTTDTFCDSLCLVIWILNTCPSLPPSQNSQHASLGWAGVDMCVYLSIACVCVSCGCI